MKNEKDRYSQTEIGYIEVLDCHCFTALLTACFFKTMHTPTNTSKINKSIKYRVIKVRTVMHTGMPILSEEKNPKNYPISNLRSF